MTATWTQFPAARPTKHRCAASGAPGPAGPLRSDLRAGRASHPGAALVAGGVFALAVLALVGLWTRSGAGVAVDSSNIVPSTLIAVLAVAAVASTYRLGHRPRPALVRSNELGSSAATVTALARANAAHMAGVSHIRILERDAMASRPGPSRVTPVTAAPAPATHRDDRPLHPRHRDDAGHTAERQDCPHPRRPSDRRGRRQALGERRAPPSRGTPGPVPGCRRATAAACARPSAG